MGSRRRHRVHRDPERTARLARVRAPEAHEPVLRLQREAGNRAVAAELAVAREAKESKDTGDTLTMDGIGEIPLNAWSRWRDDLYRIYPTPSPFEGVMIRRNANRRLKEARIVAHGGELEGYTVTFTDCAVEDLERDENNDRTPFSLHAYGEIRTSFPDKKPGA